MADIFAKLGDIKGESLDNKHKDEVEILSWSWGLSQSASTSPGGGGGAGKLSFNDFNFTHRIDKASPRRWSPQCWRSRMSRPRRASMCSTPDVARASVDHLSRRTHDGWWGSTCPHACWLRPTIGRSMTSWSSGN